MALPRFNKGHIGDLDFPDLNTVLDSTDRLATILPQLEAEYESPNIVNVAWIDARITAFAGAASPYDYEWEETHIDGATKNSIALADGDKGTVANALAARNCWEENDTPTMTTLGFALTGNPNMTITVKPLPVGCPIRIQIRRTNASGGVCARFYAPPNLFGVCNP